MNDFKLDLDRLHSVFHGDLKGHCVGSTTAVCYQAVGYQQVLSNFDIYILVHRYKDIKVIVEQLEIVFKAETIPYIPLPKTGTNNCLDFTIYEFSDNHNRVIITTKSHYERDCSRENKQQLILFDFWEDGANATSVQWNFSEILGIMSEAMMNALEGIIIETSKDFGMKPNIQIKPTLF